MKVLGKNILEQFYEKHTDSKSALVAWHKDTCDATWNTPQDIKNRYGSADFLSDNRVIFNIKGNNYRLVIQVRYQNGIIVVLWVGTHAEYDKQDFRSKK
ncbi:MAG: type II toxin-antitoxin system HigB family toxin [Methylococcaceae bacterium]|nr:type II toxin-antitoxin system HigB family toxin [Methylococcaceae bacterium]